MSRLARKTIGKLEFLLSFVALGNSITVRARLESKDWRTKIGIAIEPMEYEIKFTDLVFWNFFLFMNIC